MHPGRLIGDIGREAAHGLAPAVLAVRGVHHAWKGRALTPEEFEARRIQPGLGGGLPAGSRLHNRLIQTRGGRTILGASKLAWGATFRLPTTIRHTRQGIGAVGREAKGQYQHYKLEAVNLWASDWRPVAHGAATGARATGRATAAAGMRLHVAADVYGRPAAEATKRAAVNTATAAVLRTGTSTAASGPSSVRPDRSYSQTASREERARAEILHALRHAQREARGETRGDGT
ncbi:hypothetical protein [Streptacidiphilus anmyonensis]|uniref:hypothetical protein n=1 Tax=Streptacidiphilus anmyonensis TaxID=405782 RepID=UPI0005A6563E|nr:hypothetical protein [Streptacidiphilus anmyonensis]